MALGGAIRNEHKDQDRGRVKFRPPKQQPIVSNGLWARQLCRLGGGSK